MATVARVASFVSSSDIVTNTELYIENPWTVIVHGFFFSSDPSVKYMQIQFWALILAIFEAIKVLFVISKTRV